MTTYLSDHNKAGFEHWAKLNNLKEAARTFNYLSEHNLLNYEDFKNHEYKIECNVKGKGSLIDITDKITTISIELEEEGLNTVTIKNAVMFTAIAELFYLLKKMLLIKKHIRNNIRQSTSCMILPFRNYLVLE